MPSLVKWYFRLVNGFKEGKVYFVFISLPCWIDFIINIIKLSEDHEICLSSDLHGCIINSSYLFDIAVDSRWPGKLPAGRLWNIFYSWCPPKSVSLSWATCTVFRYTLNLLSYPSVKFCLLPTFYFIFL